MTDQQIIEQRAVSEVTRIISSDIRLRPEINISDKIPYVDGGQSQGGLCSPPNAGS